MSGFSGHALRLPDDGSDFFRAGFKLWTPGAQAQAHAQAVANTNTSESQHGKGKGKGQWTPWRDATYCEPEGGVFEAFLQLDSAEGIPVGVFWNMYHQCTLCERIFVGEHIENHSCYVKWREQASWSDL